jgi:hypothetical protein
MPLVTTQPAVKAALQTALLARTFISTNHIQVDYGEPGDSGRREAILISTAFDPTILEPLVLRKGKSEEDYILRVHVLCATLETPAKTEARAEVLAEEVQQAVIDNVTLGVAGVSWIRPAGSELVTEVTADGPSTKLTVLLSVKARLV